MTITGSPIERPTEIEVPPGLKGVIAAETALGDVRGAEGFYHYRQYAAPDLAAVRSLEDVWQLLLDGVLPDDAQRRRFAAELAPHRALSPEVSAIIAPVAVTSPSASTALRTMLSHHAATLGLRPSLDCSPEERRLDTIRLAAAVPTLIAAIHRSAQGLEPIAPRDDLGHAANYLWMLDGAEPEPTRARAIEQYLILGIDHGFNASTFTSRVVTSTGSDLGSVMVAALGALLGPLHGGAPSRALDTLDEIGDPALARDWVRATVADGRRIMGFGHPVYRTADPRSLMLREIALRIGGELVDFAVDVEAEVEAALAELKPDHPLHTNVEWYAAVVMDACGLPRELFTSTFAASRVIGWSAHALEQATSARIIRPSSRYVGTPPPVPVPVL